MSSPFSQTLRALNRDRLHRRMAAGFAVVGVGLVLLWAGWFFFAEVGLKATSAQARLESAGQPRALTAAVEGVVLSVPVALGQRVEAGAVLVVLDDTEAALALSAEQARCTGLVAQHAAIEEELEASTRAQQAASTTSTAAIQEARRSAEAADHAAQFAAKDADRAASLQEGGHTAAAETEQRTAAARQREAEAQARSWQARQTQGQADLTRLEGTASLAALQRRAVELDADRQRCQTSAAALKLAVDRHTITAPVAGHIGALPAPPPGTTITPGAAVASLVPEEDLRAVATFPLQDAGRLRPGQPARIRLDGFPWSQYGTVSATVRAVGSEPEGGGLRVELSLVAAPASIPMTHGLPGIIEVDLERMSPARLALRAAGRRLQPR